MLASGPGGQNVNKVSSAVQLRFDVARSPSLDEDVRARLVRACRSAPDQGRRSRHRRARASEPGAQPGGRAGTARGPHPACRGFRRSPGGRPSPAKRPSAAGWRPKKIRSDLKRTRGPVRED